MEYLRSIFGYGGQDRFSAPPIPEKEGITILAVEDVSASTIDEQTKKVSGVVDLRTVPFNRSWSGAPFSSKWTCRYNDFFLSEDKFSWYVDRHGNRINSTFIDNSGNERFGYWITSIEGESTPSPKLYDHSAVSMDRENYFLLSEKKLSDGRFKRKYVTKTANEQYIGFRKVSQYGSPLSGVAKELEISAKPGERYFNAFRVVHEDASFQDKVGIYNNPRDFADYEEFCRACHITRVIFPQLTKGRTAAP